MSYNVVTQYTSKAGGFAGTRSIVAYKDSFEFKRNCSWINEDITVIGEGITDEEAQKLCLLTPEVCRLTATIEEACYGPDGDIDAKIIMHYIRNAFADIKEDRRMRQMLGIVPVTGFPFTDIGSQEYEKNKLFLFVKDNFPNTDGTLGASLKAAEFVLSVEILRLIRIREFIKRMDW